jgi:hypothetical protein
MQLKIAAWSHGTVPIGILASRMVAVGEGQML